MAGLGWAALAIQYVLALVGPGDGFTGGHDSIRCRRVRRKHPILCGTDCMVLYSTVWYYAEIQSCDDCLIITQARFEQGRSGNVRSHLSPVPPHHGEYRPPCDDQKQPLNFGDRLTRSLDSSLQTSNSTELGSSWDLRRCGTGLDTCAVGRTTPEVSSHLCLQRRLSTVYRLIPAQFSASLVRSGTTGAVVRSRLPASPRQRGDYYPRHCTMQTQHHRDRGHRSLRRTLELSPKRKWL